MLNLTAATQNLCLSKSKFHCFIQGVLLIIFYYFFMQKGVIAYWNEEKGFGFINLPGAKPGDKGIFFHHTGISKSEWNGRNPAKGDEVSFEVINEARGPKAVNVVPAQASMGAEEESIDFSAEESDAEDDQEETLE